MFGLDFLGDHLTTALLLGAVTLILLYRYSTKNNNYWKEKGVPYVKPYPLLGNIVDVMKRPVHEVDLERYNKYGKIYGHFEGKGSLLLSVADPALIRQILVKDFPSFSYRRIINTGDPVIDNMLSIVRGEDWKRIRIITSPTFSTGKIKRMLSILKDCSKTLIQNMKNEAKAGKNFDAKRLYGAFTMDVIASSAFSTKIDSHNDPDNQFVKKARDVFSQPITWRTILFQIAPSIARFFRVRILNTDATVFFKEATMKIIEERKRTGQTRNDFLQLLMDTAKELSDDKKLDLPEKEDKDISENYGEDFSSPQTFKTSSKHLSVIELVAQCVNFFLAGYDTTASTLSFASYMLAMNPDVQEKLRQEVDEALRETKGDLTYEAIQNMKYLDNIISETLRICSPVIRLSRSANTDYKLGDTGITVEKGTVITIPVFAIHRDPQIYPEPEKFNPDRFTPEERAKRDQFSYLPFGAGPRNCVAMRFALLEVKVCLAHVMANFKLKRCSKTQVPLQFNMGNQGLLQPKEIVLGLERRENSS